MKQITSISDLFETLERRGVTATEADYSEWGPESLSLLIIALESIGMEQKRLYPLRNALLRWKTNEGAVVVALELPDRTWPTAWAALAWHHSPEFRSHHDEAIEFLLRHTEVYIKLVDKTLVGHDQTLPGWPWIGKSHSWVQPTSAAIFALTSVGGAGAVRVGEGAQMLPDRQLPSGGWNYGNTSIFGSQLHPLPEETGYALAALSLQATSQQVSKSLEYLSQIDSITQAPAALAWALLGMSAWGRRPHNASDLVLKSLAASPEICSYSIRYLAQLAIADCGTHGFISLLSR